MFYDCETNGRVVDKKLPLSPETVDNWPRVIELAWCVADELGIVLSQQSHFIKPEGWTVPEEEFWIEHGLTQAVCEKEGKPIEAVLPLFVADMETVDFLVSHNQWFDSGCVGAEMLRRGLKAQRRPVKICTQNNESTVKFCKMTFHPKQRRFPGQNYRWPKLTELWDCLFGKGTMVQTHRAGGDVDILRLCFFELVRRHIIKLPKVETYE